MTVPSATSDAARHHAAHAAILRPFAPRPNQVSQRMMTPNEFAAITTADSDDATGSLEAAASVLGHRSTDTTRRYARTSERRLAEAVGSLW